MNIIKCRIDFKKILRKYNFILILVCCISCTKMMDTDPTYFYTDDSFWKTSSHAIEAVNGCYRALNSGNLFGSDMAPFFNFENMTPNSFHKDNNQNTRDYATGNHTGTTLGMNNVIWTGCYAGIGRCNNVIDKVPEIDMDVNLKNRIVAEAKFLRAFYYWTMNSVFNGVPLVLTSPNMEEHGRLPRNTHAEVKAQIIKDLDEAAPHLETRYSAAEDGRATKGACYALKARVLLQDLDYAGTVAACENLFALNRYALFPNYNGMFRQANRGNSEIIFDVRWIYPTLYANYDIYHAQYNIQVPVQGLIDAYQATDGKSISESNVYDPAKPFENRDPRLAQSIHWIGRPWRGTIADEQHFHVSGFIFTKYTEYVNATTSATISNSYTPYVLLRYGDVLLMYAEALNELNGPVEGVYKAVNDVRGRESVKMPPLPVGLSKEAMREAIRLERRIEMAGEGDYFYAIRRWKTIETEMNASVYAGNLGGKYQGQLLETRKFNPQRDYFWPIPYTQIDLNPALVQDSGYK